MTSPRRARSAARCSECFWARMAEREAAARGEKALSEQRGSITQGLGVHTRGCSRATGQQHVHRPLFIDLPELELRAAQDKPPGLLVFPLPSPPPLPRRRASTAQPSPILGTRLHRGGSRFTWYADLRGFYVSNRAAFFARAACSLRGHGEVLAI